MLTEANKKYIDDKFKGNIDLILESRISEFGLTGRTVNCLLAEGIEYVKQLILKSGPELLRTPNLGRWSLNEIEDFLSHINLSLGMSQEALDKLMGKKPKQEISFFEGLNRIIENQESILSLLQDFKIYLNGNKQ
jgi:DNA-directed RNA polymerase alpha subunit